MNETFKRRLLGLIVVLVLLFALTWLLPRQSGNGEGAVPSTVVPLASVAAGSSGGGSAADELGDSEGAPQLPPDEHSTPIEPEPTATAPAAVAPTPPAGAQSSPKASASSATTPKPAVAAPAAKIDKPAAAPINAKADKGSKPDAATKPIAAAAANPAPMPATPSPSAASAVAKPAADARVWYVQIASFADQGNAQTTLSLLQNIGYRGEAAPAKGPSGNTLYRVRLGPFPTEALARAAQDKVAHQGYPQSRAVSEPTQVR